MPLNSNERTAERLFNAVGLLVTEGHRARQLGSALLVTDQTASNGCFVGNASSRSGGRAVEALDISIPS